MRINYSDQFRSATYLGFPQLTGNFWHISHPIRNSVWSYRSPNGRCPLRLRLRRFLRHCRLPRGEPCSPGNASVFPPFPRPLRSSGVPSPNGSPRDRSPIHPQRTAFWTAIRGDAPNGHVFSVLNFFPADLSRTERFEGAYRSKKTFLKIRTSRE